MESLNVIHVLLSQPAQSALATPAPPPPDLSFWGSVINAGFSEQVVMLTLLGFSVTSWAIIAYKWRVLRRAHRQSEQFLDTFWSSKQLDTIYQKSEHLSASPVSQVFRAGYIELAKLKKKDPHNESTDHELGSMESVERSMRRAAGSEPLIDARAPSIASRARSVFVAAGVLQSVIETSTWKSARM